MEEDMFSRDDFKAAIVNRKLKIYPFEEKNLTGIGYNLSTTNFAFSTKQGILLTIHESVTEQGQRFYVIIPPNDTILFFSKEYIAVNEEIAGTFHSKVTCVAQGLGHNSTTLDPTWKGQLIISVNNPTTKEIIFYIDKNGGNILTMLLHKLDTSVTGTNIHDNNKGRCDLLVKHFSDEKRSGKYKEKHLQLKEFVLNEYANSLNGVDMFIEKNEQEDLFSKRVMELKILRDKLKNDEILISENRYSLGQGGKYVLLRSSDDRKNIEECVIYKYFNFPDNIFEEMDTDEFFNSKVDLLKTIENCLYIIEYELENINHSRRIMWQNEKVAQFAKESSELVKLRQKEEKKRKCKFFIGVVISIGVIGILLSFGLTKYGASNIETVVVILAAFFGMALPIYNQLFKTHEEDM